MKPIIPAIVALLMCATAICAEELSKSPDNYRTVPHFGIPDGFYTDHELGPHMYLERCEVADTKKKMSHAEKLSAALLVIAANDATYEKYHQSYGVSMSSPLLVLLKRNVPGLGEVEPSHDVNPGALPIRDLGAFFRTWLADALSEELQEGRVRKGLRIEDEIKAEQAGAGQPATRPESKPEGGEKPQPESEGRSR